MALSADGMPRPDHGPDWRNRVCRACAATWVGHADDGDHWCPWCEQAAERQVLEQRRTLLDPPWLRTSAGDPRHDDLSEVDRAVWDRTRGQSRGSDSLQTWIERLHRAVEAGLITEAEAVRAVDRVDRRTHGRPHRP